MAEGNNPSNPDCILSAKGYKPIGMPSVLHVPLVSVDFGMTVIATEDQGRDNRIFYPMQVQQDTFSISAIFTSKARMNTFNRWLWQYAEYASTPDAGMAMGLRVQVPVRRFDYMGFPTDGWSYHFAPVTLTDITWVVTINFDGGSPVGAQSWAPASSFFGAPPDPTLPQQMLFYPYPGTAYTGDPSDSLYRKKPTPATVPKPK